MHWIAIYANLIKEVAQLGVGVYAGVDDAFDAPLTESMSSFGLKSREAKKASYLRYAYRRG